MRKNALEVIPNVYQLTQRRANMILIVEDKLSLIDTSFRGSSTIITDFIDSLGRSVEEISLIIITHGHLDHIGGLQELKDLTGAKVAAHGAEVTGAENPARGLLRIPPFSILRSLFTIKASQADIPLAGGETLEPLGGLQVIHTPGHTPGSISLYSPKHRLLIVGDALNKRHWLPPGMASTDPLQALDSIKKMSELDFDILCFGHGRPLSGGTRKKMLDWLGKTGD